MTNCKQNIAQGERHRTSVKRSQRAVLAFTLLLATTNVSLAPASERILVFAAASLQGTIDEIARRFEKEQGSKVTVSFAGSSTLARQIEQGAPADIYVSASPKWVDTLDKAKLLRPRTRSDLLSNRLVLVAPTNGSKPVPIEPLFPLAELLGDHRLAMGDPAHVPAGIYAKAALETLGVWDAIQHRVAGAVNVRSALALVARGETPYGIVYRTDAMADRNVMVVGVFPKKSHPAIIYPVAIPTTSTHPKAKEFLAFLRSATAKEIFDQHGFSILER
jgi:molybdate transport system substrate-binding protein